MDKYHGIFKQLHDLQLPGTAEFDLYEGYYAQLYEALTSRDNYDIPMYIEHASVKGGPILELACGSGRVIMHLANAGYSVVGVDLSEDMLKIAQMKVNRLPERIKRNISLQQGNMINFHIDGKYPLILLTATSVSLLDNEQELEHMLQNVYDHLEEGGRFVFDLLDEESFSDSNLRSGEIEAITINQSPTQKQFILLGEKRDPVYPDKAIMNLYAEVVDGSQTRRFFGTTNKKYFSYDSVISAINKTEFTIVSTNNIELENKEKVYMIVLEK